MLARGMLLLSVLLKAVMLQTDKILLKIFAVSGNSLLLKTVTSMLIVTSASCHQRFGPEAGRCAAFMPVLKFAQALFALGL